MLMNTTVTNDLISEAEWVAYLEETLTPSSAWKKQEKKIIRH